MTERIESDTIIEASIEKNMAKIVGAYDSFDQAIAVCGTEHDDILAEVLTFKCRKFRDAMDWGLFHTDPLCASFLGVQMARASRGANPVRVLDFGGSAGLHYFQCRHVFPTLPMLWAVVETAAVCRHAATLATADLRFFTTIADAAAWLGRVDLVHSSGAIQYTPDPEATLAALLVLNADHMVLTRLPLLESRRTVCMQLSPLGSHLPGPLPEHLADRDVRRPVTIMDARTVNHLIRPYVRTSASLPSGSGGLVLNKAEIPATTWLLENRRLGADAAIDETAVNQAARRVIDAGHVDAAAILIRDAVAKGGENAETLSLLSEIELRLDKPEESIACALRSLRVAPSLDASVNLACAHVKAGRASDAFRLAERAAADYARSPRAWELLGQLVARMPDDHPFTLRGARVDRSTYDRYCLSWFLALTGQSDGALEVSSIELTTKAVQPEVARAFYEVRGHCLAGVRESRGLSTVLDYPFKIRSVELTNRCPMKCVMCARTYAMTRSQGMMDFDVFKKVIDEFTTVNPEASAEAILPLHNFGESLTHPRFDEFISYARENGVRTCLSVNPIMLSRGIIKKLIDARPYKLIFSIDGSDDESFERIRGLKNAYGKSIENMNSFLKAKVETRSDIMVVIYVIDFEENAVDNSLIRHYRSLPGVDGAFKKPFVVWDGAVDEINALSPYVVYNDLAREVQG
ncbi:MAG: methyltransferase, TIGR04325 family, partial [Alphaproteobacteria bacterium]|nr:methyltransferase, TIGR04325 family [Alphaproteobacteria bacterium]